MPSLAQLSPILAETSTSAAKVTADKKKSKRKIQTTDEENFVIKKRTVDSGRIRNLRNGEPEVMERELPPGERFDEFFLTNFIILGDSFCAPFREGRLPDEEVNWIAQQEGTPKRNKQNQGPKKRPSSLLSEQLEMAFPTLCPLPSVLPSPTLRKR